MKRSIILAPLATLICFLALSFAAPDTATAQCYCVSKFIVNLSGLGSICTPPTGGLNVLTSWGGIQTSNPLQADGTYNLGYLAVTPCPPFDWVSFDNGIHRVGLGSSGTLPDTNGCCYNVTTSLTLTSGGVWELIINITAVPGPC